MGGVGSVGGMREAGIYPVYAVNDLWQVALFLACFYIYMYVRRIRVVLAEFYLMTQFDFFFSRDVHTV